MDHLTFIAASYGVSLLGLGVLVAWLVIDYRSQKRLLSALEARGPGRRAQWGAPSREGRAGDEQREGA